MPVGDKDHRRVAVAPAVLLGGVRQPFDLDLCQVLTSAQVGIRKPRRRDCSFYDAWRDELEVRFGHVFGPPSPQ